MAKLDRIRILWIQDTTDIPGRNFPERFDEHFEVVTKSEDGTPWPVVSMDAFKGILEDFWPGKNCEMLPVEIMAVDYDLSKASSTQAIQPGETAPDANELDEISELAPETRHVGAAAGESLDFDGLLLGIFYATLTCRHPVGFVPTTYRLSEMTASVSDFQRLSESILGIDFAFAGTERTWKNILEKGVSALRIRIERLHKTHQIVISPADLENLIASPDHDALTIRSPHTTCCKDGVRRLPVQGLFIDVSEDERDAAISQWARGLFEHIVDYDVYKKAKELTEEVWSAYCNTEWLQERRRLSQLLSAYSNEDLLALIDAIKSGECPNQEIADLWSKYRFEVTQGKRAFRATCNDSTCDVHSWGDFSKPARRWAVLLLIFRLFEQILTKRQELVGQYRELMGREYDERFPHVAQDDVFLALFPIPKTPLILPWDQSSNINDEFAWPANLRKMKDEKTKASLALSISDILDGEGWAEDGPHGVRLGERCLLQGLCRDSQISQELWRDFSAAARFIWGKRGD